MSHMNATFLIIHTILFSLDCTRELISTKYRFRLILKDLDLMTTAVIKGAVSSSFSQQCVYFERFFFYGDRIEFPSGIYLPDADSTTCRRFFCFEK